MAVFTCLVATWEVRLVRFGQRGNHCASVTGSPVPWKSFSVRVNRKLNYYWFSNSIYLSWKCAIKVKWVENGKLFGRGGDTVHGTPRSELWGLHEMGSTARILEYTIWIHHKSRCCQVKRNVAPHVIHPISVLPSSLCEDCVLILFTFTCELRREFPVIIKSRIFI